MRCWKGGWERRWERVSNGKCWQCRKGVRVLEEGGRGKGRGRGVVSKGRGRGDEGEGKEERELEGEGEGEGGERGGKTN